MDLPPELMYAIFEKADIKTKTNMQKSSKSIDNLLLPKDKKEILNQNFKNKLEEFNKQYQLCDDEMRKLYDNFQHICWEVIQCIHCHQNCTIQQMNDHVLMHKCEINDYIVNSSSHSNRKISFNISDYNSPDSKLILINNITTECGKSIENMSVSDYRKYFFREYEPIHQDHRLKSMHIRNIKDKLDYLDKCAKIIDDTYIGCIICEDPFKFLTFGYHNMHVKTSKHINIRDKILENKDFEKIINAGRYGSLIY
jgi:hypothetical protein